MDSQEPPGSPASIEVMSIPKMFALKKSGACLALATVLFLLSSCQYTYTQLTPYSQGVEIYLAADSIPLDVQTRLPVRIRNDFDSEVYHLSCTPISLLLLDGSLVVKEWSLRLLRCHPQELAIPASSEISDKVILHAYLGKEIEAELKERTSKKLSFQLKWTRMYIGLPALPENRIAESYRYSKRFLLVGS